jgi:hypothetical protein
MRAPITEREFQWTSVCHEIGFNLHYMQSVMNNFSLLDNFVSSSALKSCDGIYGR